MFDEPKFKDFHHGNSWDTGVTDAVSTNKGKATTRTYPSPARPIPSPYGAISKPAPLLLTARMLQAMEFVLERQAGRLDKGGKPYAAHSLAVAFGVAHLGEDYFIAGCLHDLVEDGEATLEEIRELFGDVVATAVDSVSRKTSPGGKKEVYMDFIRRCKKNPIGREVKLSDNTENTRPERLASLPEAERGIVNRYAKARHELLN